MQKLAKSRLLKFAKIILTKKLQVLLMFVVLVLPLAFVLVLSNKRGADGVTSTVNLVTKRFGECPTCDIKNVTQNASLYKKGYSDGGLPDKAFNPQSETMLLSTMYGNSISIIMKFDLSALQGKTIRSAKLKIAVPTNSIETTQSEGNLDPIYELNTPWNDSDGVSFNYKNSATLEKWSGCGLEVCGVETVVSTNKIGEFYFKDWLSGEGENAEWGAAPSTQLDLATVQKWVNDPSLNNGFIVVPQPGNHKTVATKTYSKLNNNSHGEAVTGLDNYRPYLEVTYEDVNTDAAPQPTNVRANYHKGQTFITWDDVDTGKDETVYRIYRSSFPITDLSEAELVDQVNQGSSYLLDAQRQINGSLPVQPDLGPAGVTLNSNSGLYVYSVKNGTATSRNTAYYTVTIVVEGNENRLVQGNTSGATEEFIDFPEAYFTNQTYYSRVAMVMWLGDYNWNDPTDPYGYHAKKSAPYFFALRFPRRAVPEVGDYNSTIINLAKNRTPLSSEEKFPLTTYLHASSHTMYGSNMTNWCAYDEGGINYGGFCIGFDDAWAEVLRVKSPTNSDAFVSRQYLNTPYGNAYYAGFNSNYIQRNAIMGNCVKKNYGTTTDPDWQCIRYVKRPDNLLPDKPMEQGRSIMYSEKSIAFVIDTLQHRSPWSKNLDDKRNYFIGGSLGAGGSLTFAVHNPSIPTAVDVTMPRAKMGEWDFKGRNLDLWGASDLNIKTQDGVGGLTGVSIWDYMDVNKQIMANRNKDLPFIQAIMGKQDRTVDWANNLPFYGYVNKDTDIGGIVKESAKIGLRFFWDTMCHGNNCQYDGVHQRYNWVENKPVSNLTQYWPDFLSAYYEGENHAVLNQALPYFNVYKLRTDQSYPAFTNFSHDDNPGSAIADTGHTCEYAIDDIYPDIYYVEGQYLCDGDLRGAINRFQNWDPQSIVDTDSKYTINLSMIDISGNTNAILPHGDVAAVEHTDVTLRRLQNLTHTPGRSYAWKNIVVSTGQLVEPNQSGTISADADGLITIPQVALTKAGTQLVLDLLPNDQPPSFTSGAITVRSYPDMGMELSPQAANGDNFFWSRYEAEPGNGSGELTFSSNNILKTIVSASLPGGYRLKIVATNSFGSSEKNDNYLIVHKLADINGDNSINFTDFSFLLSNWGTPSNPMANIVRTGTSATNVDFQDFSVLLSKWGG